MTETLRLTGNHILLNFAKTPFRAPYPFYADVPITLGGEFEYKSVEHRFQGMKALYTAEDVDWGELHDWIADPRITPQASKNRGREIDLLSDLWDLGSFHIMLEAHLLKFNQHREAREALLATGDKILVEGRKDPVWGEGPDGNGKNLCGKSLTIVRDFVRNYWT